MSFQGQSPTVKRTRYTPQSTDPVNPSEGDFFYSDGTPRDEGPWVYMNGAWVQVSTSGALTTVNNITFSPQAADPGVPTDGMVFYADGTVRTEGLWIYDGTGWVQLSGANRYIEYYMKDYVAVRVASTANVTLASAVENGDTIDGVVLATNDLVLLKNQTTATENGVYVVQVSGPPVRHSSADTFAELNDYSAYVSVGTANTRTTWFQTATLTSLSDNQVWSATPSTKSFTVPYGVYEVEVLACGGGGSGANGGGVNSDVETRGGGGGGAGAVPYLITQKTTPGESVAIAIGKGGAQPGNAGGVADGLDGNAGTATTAAFLERTLYFAGAVGGQGNNSSVGGAGGSSYGVSYGGPSVSPGGAGGNNGQAGTAGGRSVYVSTPGAGGSASTSGGGGGGGAGVVAGGAGANGVVSTNNGLAGSRPSNGGGAGGGGGGGASTASVVTRNGGAGATGGCGYVRISW